MSTPPSTAKFVSGDRVRYTISGRNYHGTIIRLYEKMGLQGWYLLTLEEFDNKKFVLPGFNMTKIEPLPTCRSCGATGSSHKCPGLQFSPRVEENPLVDLAFTLEKIMKDVSDGMENNTEPDEYHFDAGFTAGLRVALNEIAHLTSKLTKNSGE